MLLCISVDDPTAYLPAEESPGALAVLFGASVVEYLFPPFPGDSITLLGAFLVSTRGWSLARVFGAATLGSVVGAGMDWYLGMAVQRWRQRDDNGGSVEAQVAQNNALGRILAGFRRHGPVYILLNRFLPGIRALFFVAAGMAGMRPGPVLFFAALSAVLWNLVLLAVGMGIGASWERFYGLFVRYNQVMWALILIVALGAGCWWLVARRRHSETP